MKMTSMHLCAFTLVLAIAMSLAATATLIAATDDAPGKDDVVITNRAAKQSRAEVADNRETLRVRCVDGKQMTSCTGWPVAERLVVGQL